MVVAGPTAVGKTELAIQLAEHFRTVVVSCDSRQFYREMSVGTAKPSPQQLARVRHYFINNKSVTELFGAGDFAKECEQLLTELFVTHDIVVMAGGSGLYVDAVLNGLDDFTPVPPEVREQLNQEFQNAGLDALKKELEEKDPAYYAKVDKDNPQRIIRALEVIRYTHKPFSTYRNNTQKKINYTPIKLLINLPRAQLYGRINKRVDLMMEAGLLEEVRNLEPYWDYNALKTVGYKELVRYLQGDCTLEEAVDKIRQHSRNYAKRQLTWFKNKDYREFPPDQLPAIISYIQNLAKPS